MAVDTRNKRMGMIGLGLPFLRVLPDPDGGVSAADRLQLLYLYPGIAAAEVLAVYQVVRFSGDLRRVRMWTATISQAHEVEASIRRVEDGG